MKHLSFACKGAKKQHRPKIPCTFLWKLCFILLPLLACDEQTSQPEPKKMTMMPSPRSIKSTTKVIGYFVPDRSDGMIDQIAWDRLSHVIFMGIDPDWTGNWSLQAGRKASTLIPKIKDKNPKLRILAAVRGSYKIVDWIDEKNGKSRAKLIANLVKYLSDNGYEGADIDVEGSRITPNWESFILETKVALKEKNMVFSGRLAGQNQHDTMRRSAEAFDWINMTGYDGAEKLDWANVASYDNKVADRPDSLWQRSLFTRILDVFSLNRTKIEASRSSINIPTYGYWFMGDQRKAGAFSYGDFVAKYPNHADKDSLYLSYLPKRTSYYDGRPTVRLKVQEAYNWGAHIMIFRLGTDAMNEHSILETIGKEMTRQVLRLDTPKRSGTKVIGYFVPSYSDYLIDQIAWDRLSHVIFMGIDPDPSGTWQLQAGMRQASVLIPQIKAKNPNIRILGSVWSSKEIVKWIEEEGGRKRSTVIANLVKYLSDNDYDGADVDLEGSKITPNWENFILEAQDALKKEKMLFAGALAGWFQKNTTRRGAEAFDWINMMSYDATGDWNPARPGPHSALSETHKAINYFHRGGLEGLRLPGPRMALGIATYGYWFADNKKTAGGMTYAGAVAKNPAYADIDQFKEPERPAKTYYYNGRATVRQKVQIARDSNTNITIFRLGTDAMDEYSILKEIGRSMDALGMKLD